MANPQPTDAHLRIAHSINEAIMTRDFSKRQRKILDLILRLSWGCGSKYAYIPLQKDFEVVGVHEVAVKNEITWLEVSKVIIRDNHFYWFNKNYDEWEVSRVKPYHPERLINLVSINLNGNKPQLNKTLSENLINSEVTTYHLVKSSTPELASPKERGGVGRGKGGGGVGEVSSPPHPIKESIKESNFLDIDKINKIITKAHFSPQDIKLLVNVPLCNQTLYRIVKILQGKEASTKGNVAVYKRELRKLGIKWRKSNSRNGG